MDVRTYLDNERRAHPDNRAEYFAGQLRDVDNGDDVHFTARMNFAFLLNEHLSRHEFCKIYVGDMKVRIQEQEAFLYPDILMTCDPADTKHNDFKLRPNVVVEVTSEVSGGYDRGYKFFLYRHLTSLQEYILVDAVHPEVTCLRRQEDGNWLLVVNGEGSRLEIPSLDFSCEVDDIYQDVFSG